MHKKLFPVTGLHFWDNHGHISLSPPPYLNTLSSMIYTKLVQSARCIWPRMPMDAAQWDCPAKWVVVGLEGACGGHLWAAGHAARHFKETFVSMR